MLLVKELANGGLLGSGKRLTTEKIAQAPLKLTYPEGWLAQSLVSDEIEKIAGNSYCVKAFNKPEIW